MSKRLNAIWLALAILACGSVALHAEEPKKDPKKDPNAKEEEAVPKAPDRAIKEVEDLKKETEDERCLVKGNPIKLVYHAEYKGKEYHFCTRNCQKAFQANPEAYVGKAPPTPVKEEKKEEKKEVVAEKKPAPTLPGAKKEGAGMGGMDK